MIYELNIFISSLINEASFCTLLAKFSLCVVVFNRIYCIYCCMYFVFSLFFPFYPVVLVRKLSSINQFATGGFVCCVVEFVNQHNTPEQPCTSDEMRPLILQSSSCAWPPAIAMYQYCLGVMHCATLWPQRMTFMALVVFVTLWTFVIYGIHCQQCCYR